jgi:UDP-N-acetylmuramyl pentapeptide phosphotransferase/UDP-N-acetylglucosamine-1-phosphate transferase
MPWSDPAGLAALALAAAVASALGSAWAIGHARRRGMLDAPGARRSHASPTPRGGGIGIVVACLMACAWLAAREGAAWLPVGAGLALVAGAGWWDDHRPLPAWPRLLAHAIAALLLGLALLWQGAGHWVALAGVLLALGLVNAWNFMDGINGLASSQALLCAAALAWVSPPAAGMLAIVLAGACLGFLPFNFPRARVFLGDGGSGGLGYMLAVLLASAFTAHPPVSWPVLLLGPLAMLVDSGLTLGWRIRRGERWWQPHVSHAYQRWARARGHARVTVGYALWTAAALGFMLAVLNGAVAVRLAVAAAWALCCLLAWRWLQRAYAGRTEGFGS